MKQTKIKILVLSLTMLLLAFLTFRPIVNPQLEDCEILEGNFLDPYVSAKNKDIYFQISGSEKHFRINRGLEAGLSQELLDSITNKNVVVYPVNHWTLLDPNNNHPHVARLEWNGRILFSEF